MSSILKTIRSYVLWTYERGSMQYDVMVTLILVFIFLAPRWVNFKDKPVERLPHQTEVVVSPNGASGFLYQVDASAVHGSDPASIERELLRIIEPIAGEVDLVKYEAMRDARGRVVGYKVWVERW